MIITSCLYMLSRAFASTEFKFWKGTNLYAFNFMFVKQSLFYGHMNGKFTFVCFVFDNP